MAAALTAISPTDYTNFPQIKTAKSPTFPPPIPIPLAPESLRNRRQNAEIRKIPRDSDYLGLKFFGVLRILRESPGFPGSRGDSQGFPGSSRDSQSLRNSQEVPGIPRKSKSQGLPGSPRDSQEVPRVPRKFPVLLSRFSKFD